MKTITFAAPWIKRYETDDFQPSGQPRFVAVSLNGSSCALHCDHCCTRMLKALYQVTSPDQFTVTAERLAEKGCRGMLLTGGCNADGTIPLIPYVQAAREAKARFGFEYAVHTKLVTERFAEAATAVGADLLMTDIVGDDESLQNVYHLKGCTVDNVRSSLDRAQARGLTLAPHIMIGIARGQIVGEYKALEMLVGRPMATLALVVLTPLRATPMEGVNVDLEGVKQVLSKAREMFPATRLTLGCAKLGGKAQRELEEHALALNFDAIAYPSDGMVDLARSKGFDVRLSENCCAFA